MLGAEDITFEQQDNVIKEDEKILEGIFITSSNITRFKVCITRAPLTIIYK